MSKVMLGRSIPASLFGATDTLDQRRARSSAPAYFYKDPIIPLASDHIDFSPTAMVISLHDQQPLVDKELMRPIFSRLTF